MSPTPPGPLCLPLPVSHTPWTPLSPPTCLPHPLDPSVSPYLSPTPPGPLCLPLPVSHTPWTPLSPPTCLPHPLDPSVSPYLSPTPPGPLCLPLPVSHTPWTPLSPPTCLPHPLDPSVSPYLSPTPPGPLCLPLPVSHTPWTPLSPPTCLPHPLDPSVSPYLCQSHVQVQKHSNQNEPSHHLSLSPSLKITTICYFSVENRGFNEIQTLGIPLAWHHMCYSLDDMTRMTIGQVSQLYMIYVSQLVIHTTLVSDCGSLYPSLQQVSQLYIICVHITACDLYNSFSLSPTSVPLLSLSLSHQQMSQLYMIYDSYNCLLVCLSHLCLCLSLQQVSQFYMICASQLVIHTPLTLLTLLLLTLINTARPFLSHSSPLRLPREKPKQLFCPRI